MKKIDWSTFTPCQPDEQAVFKDKNSNGTYSIRTEPALGWCEREDMKSGDKSRVLIIRDKKVAQDDPFYNGHVRSVSELCWRYLFKLA